jgi:flagellar motor switch protein FliN
MSKLNQSEIDALFAQYGGGEPAAPPLPALQEPSLPEPPAPAASVFPALDPTPTPSPSPTAARFSGESPIALLAEVELEVTVRLGSTRRSIREILSLGHGAVLELDNLAGETVDILVNGLLVARGEVIVVGENYGVRIVELVPMQGGRAV